MHDRNKGAQARAETKGMPRTRTNTTTHKHVGRTKTQRDTRIVPKRKATQAHAHACEHSYYALIASELIISTDTRAGTHINDQVKWKYRSARPQEHLSRKAFTTSHGSRRFRTDTDRHSQACTEIPMRIQVQFRMFARVVFRNTATTTQSRERS